MRVQNITKKDHALAQIRQKAQSHQTTDQTVFLNYINMLSEFICQHKINRKRTYVRARHYVILEKRRIRNGICNIYTTLGSVLKEDIDEIQR
jgi:hypothetical protein